MKTTDCLVCGHTVPCPDHAPKAKKEEPYCDVCGESGADLRTPVEVCRDCYDVARNPLIAPLVANLLTKAAAYEESVRVGGSFTKNFVEGATMYPKEEDDKLRREVLLEAGQACLDWAQDTGACHLCHYDGPAKKPHDDLCPLRKLL